MPNSSSDTISTRSGVAWFLVLLAMLAPVAGHAAPLAGTYTIGATGSNYQTIRDAIADLTANGVSGPVVFDIRPGIYTESPGITDIAGASAVNTITFQSKTLNAADVVVEFTSTDPAHTPLAVWQVTGDYITLRYLTLRQNAGPASVYGRVLEVTGDADHVRIQHNRLIGTTATTTIQDRFAVLFNWKSSTYAADDVLIEDNEILNGSVGIYWGGSTLFEGSGLVIRNNRISGFGINGVQLQTEPGFEFTGNEVSTDTSYSTYPYGLLIESCNGPARIEKNRIIGNHYVGMGIRNSVATEAAPALITNNFIRTRSPALIGLDLYKSEHQHVVHNSVLVSGSMPSDVAMNVYYGSANVLLNNIAVNDATGSAIKITFPGSNVAQSDYNLLHAASGFVGITSTFTQHATLADWQAATGLDPNSVEALPDFAGPDDLHLLPGSAGIDQALSGVVADDIDNALRPADADIGADEQGFDGCVFTASVTDANCPADDGGIDLVNVSGTPPFDYAWNDGATTEDRAGLAPGNYSVTVTGPLGCNWPGDFDVGCKPPAPALELAANVTPISCAAQCDGIIGTDVSGGCPPFRHYFKPLGGPWSPSTGSEDSLCAGAYILAVRDQCGAVDTAFTRLTQPAPLLPTLVSRDNVSCNAYSDGSFELSASGGTPPYMYSINNGVTWQSSGYFDGLSAGAYPVLIADLNDCGRTVTMVITQPPQLVVTVASITNESAPGAADGVIEVLSTGGTGDHEYSINGGVDWQSSPVFSGLTAGSYTVSVQDENSCATTVVAVVGVGA